VEFVDIHTHILYGLDDGAKSLDESLAMLALAAAHGTTDIVATPHANSRYRFNPAVVSERIAELNGRSTVRLHHGSDFRLQSDTIEDALRHPTKYTINHGPYLLVEFPEMTVFPNTDDVLLQLLDAGMVPIITHPERHRGLRERIDDLTRWVQMGCCLQVTAGSVTGRFGPDARTFTGSLIARGLVHFVASDAHDTRHRPPALDAAFAALAETWGEATVSPMFTDHPRAAITGAALDHDPRPPDRRKKRWYQFWS